MNDEYQQPGFIHPSFHPWSRSPSQPAQDRPHDQRMAGIQPLGQEDRVALAGPDALDRPHDPPAVRREHVERSRHTLSVGRVRPGLTAAAALQSGHELLRALPVSRMADLRRYDPAHAAFPNLERGVGERLKMVHYDETGVIHRWILRQYGVVLLGPPPQTLIDPVSPDDLRQAVRAILPGWAEGLLADPSYLQTHDYQCYVVLSACRILYTVRHGEVVPKVASTNWAQKSLPKRWKPLVDRAWIGRMASKGQAPLEDIQSTLDFLRYALEQLDQDE